MIYKYFPLKFKESVKEAETQKGLTEIRIRLNNPVIFKYGNSSFVSDIIPDSKDISEIISYMSLSSLYAYKDEMKMGYITLTEGHRAGLCGKYIKNSDESFIKDITSINIRIAREIKGVSDSFINYCINKNVLVISPPGCGKTTFLRDMGRNFSKIGLSVGVIDERCEIAPFNGNEFVFDSGINTDVLSGCDKESGMLMMLRTMTPDVIITDEIATKGEFKAVLKIINSGVNVLASFHASSCAEYKNKLQLMDIHKDYFDTKIFLDKNYGATLC